MRLRRLALTDVGGVTSSVLVVPEQGVSVVLAPNETGKSTLLRAYRLLLSKTAHDGKPAEVKALQPIGKDVGSTIEAELVIGSETFEIARTYNKRPASALTVRGKATIERKGDEADDLLRSRFLEAVDQDLYELLHLAQGRKLEPLNGGASTTVLGALTSGDARGGQAGADTIVDALRARVGKAFHARNGTLIGELRKQEQAVEDAEQRRDDLAQKLASLTGGDGPDVEAQQVEELERELADLAERIARAAAAAKATMARQLLAAATQRTVQRTTQAADVERLIAEEKELADGVEAARKERDGGAARVTDLEQQAAGAEAKRTELRTTAAQAEADLVAALDATAAELRTTLAAEKVDAPTVKRARSLAHDVDLARASLEGGAWELVARAGRPLRLEVDGEAVELASGEELTRAVAASFVLDEDDGTRIDLHADTERLARVAQLTVASETLTTLLSDMGAEGIEALEARLTTRTDVEGRLAELDAELEEVREEPVADELPPAHSDADADLEVLRAAHEEALARLDTAGTATADGLVAAQGVLAQLEQVLSLKEEELTRAAERRGSAEQALADARVEQPDAALDEAVASAQAAVDALGEAGDAAVDGREDEDTDVLEERRHALSETLDDAKRRAHLAEGKRSSVGAFTTTLASLEEDAQALRTMFDRDVREAEAARALLERLEEARAEQGDRYRKPLEQRISELMTRLYGYECAVELDDDLRIVQRSDAEGRMILWGQLSGGAKEQAAVVVGLAIAELAGDGGVPFWIDDAIVFTDDDRVEGLKALLAESTAQVIVLTCRSELAEGLPAATFTFRAS